MSIDSVFFAAEDKALSRYTSAFGARYTKAIVAVDEVGRGCLAGPVVTCATVWIPSAPAQPLNWLSNVRDSKKLSPAKRNSIVLSAAEQWPQLGNPAALVEKNLTENWGLKGVHLKPSKGNLMRWLTEPDCPPETTGQLPRKSSKRSDGEWAKQHWQCIGVYLGASSAAEVDALNIWGATQLAMSRSLVQFEAAHGEIASDCLLAVDGTLNIKVPASFENHPQILVAGGDDLLTSIGFSSVIAKVCRDVYMVGLAQKYPVFSFESHKGYGTAAHRNALENNAPCPEHRRSFCNNINLLSH